MAFFIETLLGGLMAGMLYSLVALGFVLIYKASGVFNFSQGAMVLFAALAMARFSEWIPAWTGITSPVMANVAAFLLAGAVMFVVAWLILNIAAPLLAYGAGGHRGAMLVQPVVAMWMAPSDAATQAGSWLSYLPWASLSLQTLAALAWVVHVFRDRVLGFARDNAAARIRGS